MTPRQPAEGGPQRLQTIIDWLAQTQAGRPRDETDEKLTDALRAVGLVSPSSSWVDSVVGAAVQGHSYIVSGTTQLELAGVQLGSPLEDAPATIEVTPISPTENPLRVAPDAPRRIIDDERRVAAVVVSLFLAAGAALALCRRIGRPESRTSAGREGVRSLTR